MVPFPATVQLPFRGGRCLSRFTLEGDRIPTESLQTGLALADSWAQDFSYLEPACHLDFSTY